MLRVIVYFALQISCKSDEEGISLAEKWIFLRKLGADFLQNFVHFLYDNVGKIKVA